MAFSREIIKKVLQYVQFRVPATEEKDSYYTQISDTLVRLSNHCTRLTESDLHQIIKESVNKILKEDFQINLTNNNKEGWNNVNKWRAAANELQTKGSVIINIPLDYDNFLHANLMSGSLVFSKIVPTRQEKFFLHPLQRNLPSALFTQWCSPQYGQTTSPSAHLLSMIACLHFSSVLK